MGERELIRHVWSSSVRTDVVGTLCGTNRQTVSVIESLDASESAVYNALSDLETKGLVTETEEGWRLTATGRLIGDRIEIQRRTESLVGDEPEFWSTHDISAVPRRFRRRIDDLSDCEVVGDTGPTIGRVVQTVVDRIEAVDHCDVISPVYHEAYERVMPDNERSRLILGTTVVDNVIADRWNGGEDRSLERTPTRVAERPYALAVSDEWVIFTPPRIDGTPSNRTAVAESESAVEWGKDLYEHVWSSAIDLSIYLSDE